MLRRRFGLLAVVALSALSGCYGSYYVRPGEIPASTTRTDPAQRASIFHRAVNAVLDAGFVPQSIDADTGYLQAKRREDVQNDALAGAIAIVTVSPEGGVRVEVAGGGLYTSGDAINKAITGEQQQILAAITGAGTGTGAR